MDLLYIGYALVLWLLAFGAAAGCRRLQPGGKGK
jgi:hypothetical protein